MFEEEQVWSGLPVTIEFLSCSQVLLCYPSSRRSELSSAPRFSHRGLPWLGTPRWTDLSRSSCQWWSRRVLRMVSQTRSTPAAQLPRVGQPLSWSSTINHSQWDTVRHCETLWETPASYININNLHSQRIVGVINYMRNIVTIQVQVRVQRPSQESKLSSSLSPSLSPSISVSPSLKSKL